MAESNPFHAMDPSIATALQHQGSAEEYDPFADVYDSAWQEKENGGTQAPNAQPQKKAAGSDRAAHSQRTPVSAFVHGHSSPSSPLQPHVPSVPTTSSPPLDFTSPDVENSPLVAQPFSSDDYVEEASINNMLSDRTDGQHNSNHSASLSKQPRSSIQDNAPAQNSSVGCKDQLSVPPGEGCWMRFRFWIYYRVVTQRWFKRLVLGLILLNCVMLASANPAKPPSSPGNRFLQHTELLLQIAFTIEMVLKMLALGLWGDKRPGYEHQTGYFRDNWNRLDCFIVSIVWVTFLPLPRTKGLAYLSILRVLRPLRSVNVSPRLRGLVESLLRALLALPSVLVLLCFLCLIYSVMGLEFYNETLHQRCYLLDPLTGNPVGEPAGFCSYRAYLGLHCEEGWVCLTQGPPMRSGLASFDNAATSLLVVFHMVTMVDSTFVLYAVIDTKGGFFSLYFVSLTVFISFFAMNLILAVLFESFLESNRGVRDEVTASSSHRSTTAEEATVVPTIVEAKTPAERAISSESAGTADEHVHVHRSSGNVIEQIAQERRTRRTEQHSSPGNGGVTLHHSEDRDGSLAVDLSASSRDGIDFAALNGFSPNVQSPPDEVASWPVDTKVPTGHQKMAGRAGERYQASPAAAEAEHDDVLIHPLQIQSDAEIGCAVDADNKREPTLVTRTVSNSSQPDQDMQGLKQLVKTAIEEELQAMAPCALRLAGMGPIVLRCFQLVEHPWFTNFILAVIMLNALVLGLDHYGMSERLTIITEILNTTFSSMFLLEMILKLVAYGLLGYFRDVLNRFDCFVVVVSIMDLILSSASLSLGSGKGVGALRALRVLRIFKVSRGSMRMKIMLGAAAESFTAVGHISLLLLLFTFMCAILGQQLFATVGPLPTTHVSFSGIYWAMLSVFQLLTGDDWPNVMWNLYDATNGVAVFYCVVVVSLGVYIFLNLFVTVVLEGFNSQNEALLDYWTARHEAHAQLLTRYARAQCLLRTSGCRGLGVCFSQSSQDHYKAHCAAVASDTTVISANVVGYLRKVQAEREAEAQQRKFHRHKQRFTQENIKCEGISLGCLRADNIIRRKIFALVTSWTFNKLISLAILVNCVFSAIESPSTPPHTVAIIRQVHIWFAAIFSFEIFLKIVAFGLYGHPYAYLSSPWNVLDAVIVVFSILAEANVPLFRNFRAARLLRVIIRKKEVRVVASALFAIVPAVANVLLLISLLWYVFCVVAVSLFAGRLSACSDIELFTKSACLANGALWITQEQNFDSLPASFFTLFQVGTLSSWTNVMYAAINSTGVDQGPEFRASPLAAVFFIVFVVICSFFSVNLVVGAVLETFAQLKGEYDGFALMTEEQVKVYRTRQVLEKCRPRQGLRPPTSNWRKPFYRLVSHPMFERVVVFLIVLNISFMMLQHYDQSEAWSYMLYYANVFFTLAFTLETLVKIAGLGFRQYIMPSWNKLDFFLVLMSYVGFIAGSSVTASIFRLLRVGRLMRLVPRAKSLSKLVEVLRASSASLLNVGSLVLVIYFFFAVLGVQLFGEVCHSVEGFDDHANFENLFFSFIALYRITVGDAWERFMIGATLSGAECEAANCCGYKWGKVYFVCFMIVGRLVMINLFIAVILENYPGEDPELLRGLDFLSEAWCHFDPEKTGILPARLFLSLLSDAPEPFGLKRGGSETEADEMLALLTNYNIPAFYQRVPPSVSAQEQEMHRNKPKLNKANTTSTSQIQVERAGQARRSSNTSAFTPAQQTEETGVDQQTPAAPAAVSSPHASSSSSSLSSSSSSLSSSSSSTSVSVPPCAACNELWATCQAFKTEEAGEIEKSSPAFAELTSKRLAADAKYVSHQEKEHPEQVCDFEYCVHFKRTVFAMAAFFLHRNADSFSLEEGGDLDDILPAEILSDTVSPSPQTKCPRFGFSCCFSRTSADTSPLAAGQSQEAGPTVTQMGNKRRNSLLVHPRLQMHEWYSNQLDDQK
eukprot:g80867.t1